jgi:hypothetical protein
MAAFHVRRTRGWPLNRTAASRLYSLPNTVPGSTLIERFFSKAARSVLRHIRVKSTHELKQRIIEFINDLNRDPVIAF